VKVEPYLGMDGHAVVMRRDGKVFRFRVTGASVVRFDHSGIDPYSSGRRLVLSTCWPLNARTQGPLRYVVHAEMVADVAADSGS